MTILVAFLKALRRPACRLDHPLASCGRDAPIAEPLAPFARYLFAGTVPPPLVYIGPAKDLGESIHLALKHLLSRAEPVPLDIAIAPLLARTIFGECLLK
jgi:hypothetical protein